MNCSQCGYFMSSLDKDCPRCGAKGGKAQLVTPTFVPPPTQGQTQQTYPQQPSPQLPPKKHVSPSTAIFIVLMIVVVIPSFLTFFSNKPSSTTSTSSFPSEGSGTSSLFPSSTSDVVTKSEFDQLQTGMSYSQAVSIIGTSGEMMSENQIADIHTVMYMWRNEGGANMNAMFQNDRLIQKAQFGLS